VTILLLNKVRFNKRNTENSHSVYRSVHNSDIRYFKVYERASPAMYNKTLSWVSSWCKWSCNVVS